MEDVKTWQLVLLALVAFVVSPFFIAYRKIRNLAKRRKSRK